MYCLFTSNHRENKESLIDGKLHEERMPMSYFITLTNLTLIETGRLSNKSGLFSFFPGDWMKMYHVVGMIRKNKGFLCIVGE